MIGQGQSLIPSHCCTQTWNHKNGFWYGYAGLKEAVHLLCLLPQPTRQCSHSLALYLANSGHSLSNASGTKRDNQSTDLLDTFQ